MSTQTNEQKEAQSVPERPVWYIPCWLCGMTVEVTHTKKNKPCITCNDCGIQTFIRYRRGEERLMAIIKQQEEDNGNREIYGDPGAAKVTKSPKTTSRTAKTK